MAAAASAGFVTGVDNFFVRRRCILSNMESVYETSFAFQAQMIFNLLESAGVPARIDGSYLQGIGGEIPLGNAVRVRVEPERAAEARAIIAEWDSAAVPSDEEAAAEAEAAGLGAGKKKGHSG